MLSISFPPSLSAFPFYFLILHLTTFMSKENLIINYEERKVENVNIYECQFYLINRIAKYFRNFQIKILSFPYGYGLKQ